MILPGLGLLAGLAIQLARSWLGPSILLCAMVGGPSSQGVGGVGCGVVVHVVSVGDDQ